MHVRGGMRVVAHVQDMTGMVRAHVQDSMGGMAEAEAGAASLDGWWVWVQCH